MAEKDNEVTKYKCPETNRFLKSSHYRRDPDEDGFVRFSEDECRELAGNVCRASCNYPFLYEWHYEILNSMLPELGFSEFSTTKVKDDGVHRITQIVTTKGLLASENRATAVWHFGLPDQALPPVLVSARNRRVAVEHRFRGEKFFLVRTKRQVRSYPIEQVNPLEQITRNLNSYLHTPFDDWGIDPETGILTINSSWIWLAMTGLAGKSLEEEERVRLSDRLAESQPFFEFKAPLQIDWNSLKNPKDDSFQEICRLLLLREPGVRSATPIGKTRAGDRGRDIEVVEATQDLVDSTSRKWLVQCKFSTKSISPDTISGWTDRVREHGYDGYWLMTNNDITPSLFDQFKDVERNTGIKTRFWQRSDFHIKLNVHAEILKGIEFFGSSDVAKTD